MAEVYTSKFRDIPVVAAYCNDKLEYLSVVSKNTVGNIYVCRVENIVKNIGSAFVKYGEDELGYWALRNMNPANVISRTLEPGQSVKSGDLVMLQIEADPIKTKKAKMTSLISVSGRFSVVTLGRSGVGTSNKLGKAKREILIDAVKPAYKDVKKDYLDKLKGTEFGVILRTSCVELLNGNADAEVQAPDIRAIMDDIIECLEKLTKLIGDAASRTPGSCLYENASSDIESHVEKAEAFLKFFSPGEEIRRLEDTGIRGINSDIEELFHNRIWLKSGAFLIIEQLESFNAIDVNTGKAIQGKNNIISKVNSEAATEIMRQIRLRNLTGMILIDFINMKDSGESEELIKQIRTLALRDPVHTEFIDITGLGIMELTRNKNSKSLRELF